ncbi:hypothetical protein ATZ33_13730 [Enterococcus silesiacus]|uniref:Uncharacterized protein n=1 Tax=Enterococcus silesiacus TaxID=332949 RepID=A0A0S3KDP6_9ENTE|nr:hypothetical protein [Enterococcus silesiacus]ALS02407.1 hypothetical protein ATZ33_13730 [Enterococcus silesiacus]OJG88196.1 hypothetical protein RV15_GL001855 [Enterococcus silesiacus]
MKKTADDYYFFIAPIKYRLEFAGIKASRMISLIAVACFPIMYLYIDSFEYEGIYFPNTMLFQVIVLFFLVINVLILFSLLLIKTKIYDPIIHFLVSWGFLEISYVLLIVEYRNFLSNSISKEYQDLAFDILLFLPFVFILISIVWYLWMILTGKTHKKYPKVIEMEKKVKGDSDVDSAITKSQGILLIGTSAGIGIGGLMEGSFVLFILLTALAYFIAFVVGKSLFLSFAKFKFPKHYSEKALEVTLKRDGWEN